MELLYFVLSAFGLTQILVYGSIFNNIRPSKERLAGFFHCPMCVGFWVGVLLYVFSFYTELFTFENNYVNPFILGWLSSGTSYVLCTIFGDEGINVKQN